MTMLIPADAHHVLISTGRRTAIVVFGFPTAVVERQPVTGP